MIKSTSLFVPLLTAACVAAHGFLSKVTIQGKAYTGNVPAAADKPSVIRQVSSAFPNKGATNVALTCGPDSTAGTLVADANPGDSLSFAWNAADMSNWPHNTGPMLTYLANCGETTCDKFDISTAKWFKIEQIGRKPNSADWAQADLMTGGVATATLPANLAAGNYLLRHEIIALHLATSVGGAEFYPACAQIKVGGTQTGTPDSSELVSIPGAYTDKDPGIFDPNVFDPKSPYTFPGPKIASFVGGDTTGGTSTSGGSNTTSSSSTSGSASPAQTSKAPKSCKLKNRASTAVLQPRHISRIMRRFTLGQSLH